MSVDRYSGVNPLLCNHCSELISCRPVSMYPHEVKGGNGEPGLNTTSSQKQKKLHYIDLVLTVTSKSVTTATHGAIQTPRVRCESQETANRVSRHVSGEG